MKDNQSPDNVVSGKITLLNGESNKLLDEK
jgi:hypothetical protein